MELNKKLNFEFKGNSYSIEYPTVGQYLDIENEKIKLSQGNWGKLVVAGTISAYRATQIIDCVANLKILCPQIFKDMKVDVFEIDAKDFAPLVLLFQNKVRKWYNEWFDAFNAIFEESKSESEN